jgi:hypothetical protein
MAKRAAWDRLGALSGVLAGLLMAAGFMLGDPYDPATDPDPTDPPPLLARALIPIIQTGNRNKGRNVTAVTATRIPIRWLTRANYLGRRPEDRAALMMKIPAGSSAPMAKATQANCGRTP